MHSFSFRMHLCNIRLRMRIKSQLKLMAKGESESERKCIKRLLRGRNTTFANSRFPASKFTIDAVWLKADNAKQSIDGWLTSAATKNGKQFWQKFNFLFHTSLFLLFCCLHVFVCMCTRRIRRQSIVAWFAITFDIFQSTQWKLFIQFTALDFNVRFIVPRSITSAVARHDFVDDQRRWKAKCFCDMFSANTFRLSHFDFFLFFGFNSISLMNSAQPVVISIECVWWI